MNERLRAGRWPTSSVIRQRVGHELVEVIRVAIGQLGLEVRPDELIGIEFGRVARKPLEVQTGTACQQRPPSGPL